MSDPNGHWLPFSLFLLPAFALPAFFLHPDGFTWVFLRSIRDSIIRVFTTIGQVKAVLREGALVTYLAIFWVFAVGAAVIAVRRMPLTNPLMQVGGGACVC
jgi:hypothetical protein